MQARHLRVIVYVGLWVMGSILEAFDSYSWKVAEVVSVE
jgi:hypothetical protein